MLEHSVSSSFSSPLSAMMEKRRVPTVNFPPSSRYDRPGEYNNERVREVYKYALERTPISPAWQEMVFSIFCLHDHKGTLHVVSTRKLSEHCEVVLRLAWEIEGVECVDAVEFYVLETDTIELLKDDNLYDGILASIVDSL